MDVNIDILPDEILVKIFRLLPHQDLLAMSCVSNRFNNIVNDRQVVRCLDLQKVYNWTTEEFKTFFLPHTRCQNIQRVNLNHVYWIKLPNFVVKLKNLVSLHMLGIRMKFMQLKWILTSCPKLQDLSISWPYDMESDNSMQWMGGFNEVKEVLSLLESLHILIHANPVPVLELLGHCTGLKKLVITNHHASRFLSTPGTLSAGKEYNLKLPHLQDLIIDHADGSFPDHLIMGLLHNILEGCKSSADWRTYWTNTPVYLHAKPFRNQIDIIKNCWRVSLSLTPSVWTMMREAGTLSQMEELLVKGHAPCSMNLTTIVRSCPNLKSLNVMNGLNLTLDIKKVSEILPKLERLSICCQPEQGPSKIAEGIATFHHLTHLTVPICALIETQQVQKTYSNTSGMHFSNGYKRQRLGVPTKNNLSEVELAAFNLVFQNCPMITVLEIGFNKSTSCSPAKIRWECLENVKKLKKLTHLTLDGIPITNGRFLIEIAKGCTELEFLRLKHLGPSGICCYISHLSQALAFCKNLVHLRIEQNYLAPGTAIFKALIECEKLERLFFHAERDMVGFDTSSIDDLIEKRTSLVFVFIVGSQTFKDKCAKLTRKYRYKNLSRPALVVRVRRALWDVFDDKNTETRTTPACHYNDMITFRSWTFDSFT
ncbi:uncharacterized protein LOC121877731 isoform X1 [Homarus americanus]|uniref:uncharacterized protein LOC121877731 isoform X1 n=1 Tax=Homarus americanus TaxID=6706 RepID=UPI001C479520|nr:uncharacterized protein LOC121877731 isoform X1 [Homarus americanus]